MSEKTTESAGQRVVRNTLFMFGQQVVVAVATIFIAALIARHLGKSMYGIFTYTFALVTVFMRATNFGLRPVSVRSIARDQGSLESYGGLIFTLRLILSVLSVPVLLVISFLMGHEPIVQITIGIASGTLVFNTISTTFRDIFQGLEKLEFEAITAVGVRLFTLVGALIAIGLGGELVALVSVYTAGALFGAAIPFYFIRRHKISIRPWLRWKEVKEELRKGLPFTGTNLIGMFLSRINPVLIGMLSTHAMVGLYGAAFGLIMNIIVIPDAIATALFPTVARGWKDPNVPVGPIIRRSLFFMVLTSVPMAVGGVLCAGPIIHLIFGDEFKEAVPVFQILLLTLPLDFVALPVRYVLGAIHRQHQVLVVHTIAAAINVTLNVLWVPEYGALGSAWAALATAGFRWAAVLFCLAQAYRPWEKLSLYVRIVLANGVMAAALLPIHNQNPLWVVPIGIAVYGVSILIFRVMTVEQAKSFSWQLAGRKRPKV